MILLIDNYDSFTYNLYQLLATLGAEVEVRRNDALSPEDIGILRPAGIVISPGPGDPDDAGVSVPIVRAADENIPVLGVCLGLQCIGAAFGGRIERARTLMHGKISPVHHDGRGVFAGVPSPFDAVRYHSLAVNRNSVPACLEISAQSDDGTIMGLRHRDLPIEGVQFHPESVLTLEGPRVLRNFLQRTRVE
jgi:anthranilate synthase component 2